MASKSFSKRFTTNGVVSYHHIVESSRDTRFCAILPKRRVALQSGCLLKKIISSIFVTRTRLNLPASRPSPSLPTTTQDALHSPQTKRSFPSFIHPHFEAATASIAGGLLAYVESLNVERRVRKDGSEDGRYSAVAGRRGAGEGE